MASLNNNQHISAEEQTKAIDLGRKLALFVAALPGTAQEKEEIVAFIQGMSKEQMIKMGEITDEIYAESKTVAIDEKFKKDLLAIKEEYEKKNKKVDNAFLQKLADLENKLKK